MSEREKEVIQTIAEAAPHLSERQRSYLLGYGDAILDMRERKKEGDENNE